MGGFSAPDSNVDDYVLPSFERGVPAQRGALTSHTITANLRTDIMDFGGFDSNIMLILRGGILRTVGGFPESLSQAILVGIILVGRLGAVLAKMIADLYFNVEVYIQQKQ